MLRERPRAEESASEPVPVSLDDDECESERESFGAGGRDDGLGKRGAIRDPIPLALWFWL